MTWRMAKALDTLLAQINALAPNRDKSSDGGIGNAEHSARESDHNPNDDGVVCARDFTNDPPHGIVSEELAEALRASRDPRIKYIISNRKIAASYPVGGNAAWEWRPYSGANPHNHHCHISVLGDKVHYDDTKPWAFTLKPIADAPPIAPTHPTLRNGAKDADENGPVHKLQNLLNGHGATLKADGDFGTKTSDAVVAFQKSHGGLVVEPVVGIYTWEALERKS